MAEENKTADNVKQSAQDAKTAAAQKKIQEFQAKMDKLKSTIDVSKKAEESAEKAKKAMEEGVEKINNLTDELNTKIKDKIKEFKKIPPKIRSIVDVQGETMGLYDKLDDMYKKMQAQLSSIQLSIEVPISPDDYYQNPSEYPSLQNLQMMYNTVTQEMCDKSEYKKISVYINPEWQTKMEQDIADAMPENRDIVAQQAEKLINAVMPPLIQTVVTPVKTIGGMVPIGELGEMVTGLADAVEGIGELASMEIDEDMLNQKMAQSETGKDVISDQAGKASEQVIQVAQTEQDAFQKKLEDAKSTSAKIEGQTESMVSAAKDAFKNIKAPDFPNDIKETLDDFQDSIITVKNNLSNIYIILILKMIGQIVDCLKMITDVPTIPSPLGQIPQVITDAKTVMDFVNGLPQSAMTLAKSVVRKKIKAIMVLSQPTPPAPLEEITPEPPSSKDVVTPSITWDDCQKKLEDVYGFSKAAEIVKNLQEFYDGSGVGDSNGNGSYYTHVADGVDYDHVGANPEHEDRLPKFVAIKQTLLTPLMCFNQWIDSHVDKSGSKYMMKVMKANNVNGVWYKYDSEGEKEIMNYPNDWGFERYLGKKNDDLQPFTEASY